MSLASPTRAVHNLALAREKRSEDPTLALRIADYVRKWQGEAEAAQALMEEIIADRRVLFYHTLLRGHDRFVFSVAFSPNGQELVSTGADQALRRWRVDGHPLFVVKQNAITAVFSPGGQTILASNNDQGLLLDLGGDLQMALPRGDSKITSVAFSPDGNLMLTGDRDGAARLFNREGSEVLKIYGKARKVFSVAFHPSGQYFLTGNFDTMNATLWDLKGNQIQAFNGHESIVFGVAFSPDGQWVLTGSRDKTVRLWDMQGRELLQVKRDIMSVVSTHSIAFSPHSNSFLTADREQTAAWYDLSGQVIAFLPGAYGCNAIAFSPDGQHIATGDLDHFIRIWSTQSRQDLAVGIDDFLEKYVCHFTPEELAKAGMLLELEDLPPA